MGHLSINNRILRNRITKRANSIVRRLLPVCVTCLQRFRSNNCLLISFRRLGINGNRTAINRSALGLRARQLYINTCLRRMATPMRNNLQAFRRRSYRHPCLKRGLIHRRVISTTMVMILHTATPGTRINRYLTLRRLNDRSTNDNGLYNVMILRSFTRLLIVVTLYRDSDARYNDRNNGSLLIMIRTMVLHVGPSRSGYGARVCCGGMWASRYFAALHFCCFRFLLFRCFAAYDVCC